MTRLAGFFVRFFEYAIPDPYIFAVGLTLITAILAFAFAPRHALNDVLAAWYKGIFEPGNLGFALQMILILVTGYALANSAPVARALEMACRASAHAERRRVAHVRRFCNCVLAELGIRFGRSGFTRTRHRQALAHRLRLARRGGIQRIFDLGE